ncbi:MAG TPA: alpha/beta fold hydrolase [Myxococcales bacterium]
MKTFRAVSALALPLACAGSTPSQTGSSAGRADLMMERPRMEEHLIPSDTAGIQLYLRNKRLEKVASDRILLFVHGSTYPAETSFDLPLGGISFMDFLARGGWDVWLVDLRGYGRSTRPPEMDQPPGANPPIVTTDVAVRDVASAVDFILAQRKAPRIALMGWSWGTTIMAGYTVRNPGKVSKLVLYAPQWLRTTPSLIVGEGAYRTVSMDSARDRWLKGVPEDKRKDLIPDGWFEQWAQATFATDPVGSKQNPPVLRAPNGTLRDTKEYWSSGKPYYDPAQIKVPVLIVHAEWDQDLPNPMPREVFSRLTSAPYRRLVEIGEGTHTVIMEKNRDQLFNEVRLFLDELR